MATKNVNIDIIAKDKTAQAMRSATAGVNNLKQNVQSSVAHQRRSFLALGGTIKMVVGTLAVIETIKFAKQMVMLTSSVEEMQAKSSVVFGNFARSVRTELSAFGDQVGRSSFELEGMASSIQDTFVPMGFARGEASKLSVQLTKLAVDVASFNNASDTETMMAFQSALVGNHETVRRFGVVITEATLKQELLRMGINKASKDVTNAEKVQARLNLIIAGTSDAQGDAIRTSDSFANTSKALSAQLEELQVSVMQPLLPVLTDIVRGMIDATKATTSFLESIGLIPRNFEDTKKTATTLNKLLKEQGEIEAHIAKLNTTFQKDEIKRFNIILDKLKERIKAERGLLTVLDMQRKQQHQLSDQITKDNEAEKKKRKELEVSGFVTQMGKVPVNAHLREFSDAERLEGVKNIADQEFEIVRKMNADKIQNIMDFNELEMEIARINADKKLKLAHATAMKEKEIRTNIMKENLSLLSEGKANEIDLEKLTSTELNAMAKETGQMALKEMAQHNRKAFELNKAFAIANAIINTATGITKALQLGPIGVPLAVAIGALGVAQVATISKTKYQGRRLGGRMNQGEPYMVGEAGAELVVPDRPSNVIPNNKLGNEQPVTVNFNINTVDARGFNELLVNSRGVIVNMINQAVNEKGRMAIV